LVLRSVSLCVFVRRFTDERPAWVCYRIARCKTQVAHHHSQTGAEAGGIGLRNRRATEYAGRVTSRTFVFLDISDAHAGPDCAGPA
jgi:hypothetical protein